jgi:hypothetical protein
MCRSRSVTWAAIATLLLSLPPIALGLLGVLDLFGPAPHQERDPAIFYSRFEILSAAAMTLIPGIWGLATGVGLLALKLWARFSIIAFAAVTIAFMVITFGLDVVATLAIAKRTQLQTIGDFAYHIGVPVFYVGISVWFLVLFNQPRITQEFDR